MITPLFIFDFLVALLGAWLGKRWLAKRPVVAWTIIAAGCVGLAVLLASGPMINTWLSGVLVPGLASLAAGIGLSKLDLNRFVRGAILLFVAVGIDYWCSFHQIWDGL